MRTLLVISILTLPLPLRAQSTCGGSAAAPADHLPSDVEAITTQISPGWGDPDRIIAGITRSYHECDGGAATQAIFDRTRKNAESQTELVVL